MSKKIEQEILFEYQCEACQEVFDFWLTMSQKRPKKCPSCGKHGLNQLFTTNVICNFIESAKTFGKAAEINAKREGKAGIERMEENDPVKIEQDKQKKNTPWWRSGKHGTKKRDKPLDISKIKDTQKYIETGEQ